jgi:hypothetical protein
MAVVINGVVQNVGQVVGAKTHYTPVSSDRAMLDTGYSMLVTLWDGVRGWTEDLYTDDRDVEAEADVGGEGAAAYERWNKVRVWLLGQRAAAYKHIDAHKQINRGDVVEVFKGRKCPLGVYRVVRVGDGQYGAYADLDPAGGGKAVRFVSLGNMRKQVAPWRADTADLGTADPTAVGLATAASKERTGYGFYGQRTKVAQAYLILADRLEELGLYDQADALRHQPDWTERKTWEWEKLPEWVSLGEDQKVLDTVTGAPA